MLVNFATVFILYWILEFPIYDAYDVLWFSDEQVSKYLSPIPFRVRVLWSDTFAGHQP